MIGMMVMVVNINLGIDNGILVTIIPIIKLDDDGIKLGIVDIVVIVNRISIIILYQSVPIPRSCRDLF
mgnify:CR=1 FL=1